MPELINTRKLVKKVTSFFKRGVPEEEMFHKDLVKITTQMKMTTGLIQNNIGVLKELAKEDANVATLLEDALDNSKRKDIGQKILSRQDISQSEAKYLTESLERMTGTLAGIGASLEVDLGESTANFQTLLNDNRIDIQQRRKILEETRSFLGEKGVESPALEELKDVTIDNLNFTKEETESLNTILDKLVHDTTDTKIHTTLNDLNKSMDSAVLTQEELKEVMEKQTAEGKAFREVFEDLPGMFTRGRKGGVILSLLDAWQPGLGSLLEGFGGLEAITGYAIFKKFGSFFGKEGPARKTMSGMAVSVKEAIKGMRGMDKVTKVLRSLGKLKALKILALPAAAILAAKAVPSMFTSFFKRIPNMLTSLKVLALPPAAMVAIKAVPNMFTSFFKRIPNMLKGLLKIPGVDKGAVPAGKIAGKIAGKSVSKVISKSAVKTILKKLPILGVIAGAYYAYKKFQEGDLVGAGLELTSGTLGALGLFPASLAVDVVSGTRDVLKIKGSAKSIPGAVESQAQQIEMKRYVEQTKQIEKERATIPALISQAMSVTQNQYMKERKTTDRRLSVDDYGISLVNSLLFN